MKAKIGRRRMRQNAWKMAKAIVYGTVVSYKGIGKKWKVWANVALNN